MSDYSLKDFEQQQEVLNSKPVKRLFTPFLSKRVPPIPELSEREAIPLFNATILSRTFLFWLTPLLKVGYKRTLVQEDLWVLDDELSLEQNYLKFQSNMDYYIQKNSTNELAVLYALLKSMEYEYLLAITFKSLANVASAFTPFLMKYLVETVEMRSSGHELKINKGIGYSFGIAILMILVGILKNQGLLLSYYVGSQSRTILTKALLQKSITASKTTKCRFSNGKIISMMGADLERIDEAICFLPDAISSPFPIIIGIIILVINLRVSALAGIATFFLALVLMVLPMKFLLDLRKRTDKLTDERVSITREILLSIKIIKFYSWENAYESIIKRIRFKESSLVLRFQIIISYMISLVTGSPLLNSMAAILVYYAVSGHGSAAIIFSSLSLFSMISNQVIELPGSIAKCVQGYSGILRISEFIRDEHEFDHTIEPTDEKVPSTLLGPNDCIKMVDCSFEWVTYEEKEEGTSSVSPQKKKLENEYDVYSIDDNTVNFKDSKLKLFNKVNITIGRGELIVVIGSIGSGKSSFLSALSGEMAKSEGSLAIEGSFILCATPWIQNTSIRENILFGSSFEFSKYQNTINACGLSEDLKEFSSSDLTEVGERGITLSGGQKVRLSLARAVYSDKDIYLLDDIVSAVDPNMGEHLLNDCLFGILKDKTRILATNQLSMVSVADKIIFIGENGTLDFGTADELQARNSGYRNLMEFDYKNIPNHKNGVEVENSKRVTGSEMFGLGTSDNSLYKDEERAFNSIPLSLYLKYLDTGSGVFGMCAFPLLLLLMTLATFVSLFTNVWLSFWIEMKFPKIPGSVYIGLYICFTILSILITWLLYAYMSYFITRSSRIMILKAIHRVLHTPMSYMDTTPIGRILNRFTKDCNSLDNEVGSELMLFVYCFSLMIGILILSVVYIPWFALAIPIFAVVFVSITNFYQASSREVKRLEAINRSFVINNFNEVLGGLSTIKAYKTESLFSNKNSKYCDQLNEVNFIVNANQRWIGIAVDIIGGIITFIISILSVTGVFNLSASSAGLLLTNIIDFSQILTSLVEFYSGLENEMNSVERIHHYAFNLDQEAPYYIKETDPGVNWPSSGGIEMKNVSMKYRAELPFVLKDLSLSIDPGSKIGVCGRTGAGKSSLMNAIFRINELKSGRIEIDGVDISKLGLNQLRSKLSIIPQDPVLFEGTLRRNLDPFDEYTDDTLWDSLRRSGLLKHDELERIKIQTRKLHKFHLLNHVDSEGSNFSLGEKQLIALTRTIARNSRILIMDEATASVDYRTDALIQQTILNEFNSCTILCVAHRLRTILNYDKIIVMDKGKAKESGKPFELFEKGGIFTEMCKASGITESDFDSKNKNVH